MMPNLNEQLVGLDPPHRGMNFEPPFDSRWYANLEWFFAFALTAPSAPSNNSRKLRLHERMSACKHALCQTIVAAGTK
jgi:hypothetical protein